MFTDMSATLERPPSANEGIKTRSNFLRGTIADGLSRLETGDMAADDQQLVKFHGMYVQDDRDLRAERGKQKMEKAFMFMVRLRVPAGVLTPAQWLAAEGIVSISLNPDSVVETWTLLAKGS